MIRVLSSILLACILQPALAANPTSAPASQPVAQRWAIISSPDLQKTGIPDLVLAKVSSFAGITLVERDQIESATRELTLSSVAGSQEVQARLKLGRILRADVLVLMASKPIGRQQSILLVIADCALGARLAVEQLTISKDAPDALVEHISTLASETRQRFAGGIKSVIGVSPFLSNTLVHDWDYLQSSLAYVVQNAFMARPGVAVIEMEEAQTIRRERELAAGPIGRGVVPLFVEGQYRVEIPSGKSEPLIQIAATLKDGEKVLGSFDRKGLTLSAATKDLQAEAAKWSQARNGNTTNGISVDQQVAFMLERAKAFARLGAFEQSSGLREACLLLSPTLNDERVELVRDYRRLLRPAPPWWDGKGLVETPELEAFIQLRLSRLKTCFAHIEYLAHRSDVADDLPAQLCTEIAADVAKIWEYEGYYAKESEGRKRYFEQMESLKQEFIDNVFPVVRRRMNDEKAWNSLLVSWVSLPFGPTHFDWQARRIRSMGQHLVKYTDPGQPVGHVLVFWINEVFLQACRADREQNEAFKDFAKTLQATGQPRYLMLVRLCELHIERCMHAGGGISIDEMIVHVEKFLEDARHDQLKDMETAGSGLLTELERIQSRTANRRNPSEQMRQPHSMAAHSPAEARRNVPTLFDLRQSQAKAPVVHMKAERLSIQVEDKAGKLRPLTNTNWNAPFMGHGRTLKLLHCGAADVYWNSGIILLHDTPNKMKELYVSSNSEIEDAVFDGKRLWVGTRKEGIQVFALSGKLELAVNNEQRLPPCDQGLRLHAMEPGKLLAVGSFGSICRAWLATIQLTEAGAKVHVFHECPEPFDPGAKLTDPKSSHVINADPKTAFKPHAIHFLGGAEKVGIVHVERWGLVTEMLGPLQVNLKDLSISTPGRPDGPYVSERPFYQFDNGMTVDAPGFCVCFHSPSDKCFADGRNTVMLPQRASGLTDLGDYLYFYEYEWFRINKKTYAEQAIVIDRPADIAQGHSATQSVTSHRRLFRREYDVKVGVSVFHGLIVWSDYNEFFKLNAPSSDGPALSHADLKLMPLEARPKRASTTMHYP